MLTMQHLWGRPPALTDRLIFKDSEKRIWSLMHLLKAGISVSGEATCRIGTQTYRVNSPQRHYYTTIYTKKKVKKFQVTSL